MLHGIALKASNRLAIPVRIPFFRKGGKVVKNTRAKATILIAAES